MIRNGRSRLFYAIGCVLGVALLTFCARQPDLPPGTIITIAGGPDFSGDGGPATEARLIAPNGVFAAPDGTIYLTDTGQSAIRKITPDGTIETVAGMGEPGYSGDDGPAIEARMNYPNGLLMDSSGNLLIGEEGSHVIRKIDPQGRISTIAGTGVAGDAGDGGPATQAQLKLPRRLALAPDGTLYFSDGNNHRVRRITPDGVIMTVAGTGKMGFSGDGGPATEAEMNIPRSVTLDGKGNLYILDSVNFRVRKVDTKGIITTVAGTGTPGFSGDGGPAVKAQIGLGFGLDSDAAGNIYIADSYYINARVRKIDTRGIMTTVAGCGPGPFSGDGGPATLAHINVIGGIDVDAFGNLYIADSGNNRIRKVDTNGIVTTVAGSGSVGDNGPATMAGLYFPLSVTVDDQGVIYIADSGHNRIRRIDPSGTVATIAGTGDNAFGGDDGQARDANLNGPTGLHRDAGGHLYIADLRNNRIRKIDIRGIITTVAGSGKPGYSGDGGLAVDASLTQPSGIWKDNNGNLYIADSGNHRIRKVDPDGIITTVAGIGEPGYSGDDGPAADAVVNVPRSPYMDGTGALYITDSGNHRIRKINEEGIITTVAGNGVGGYSGDGGAAIDASLNQPGAVFGDDEGHLYISDIGNNRVRVVRPDGSITTLAGTGAPGFGGDGGPARDAQTAAVGGFVDASGDIYLSEPMNFRVRKIIGPNFGR